jgi:hypothetical protein
MKAGFAEKWSVRDLDAIGVEKVTYKSVMS